MIYERSQTAWLICSILGLVFVFITLTFFMNWGPEPMPLVVYILVSIVTLLIIVLFYQLNIRVDEVGIHLIYGIGIIHITLRPQTVIKAEPSKMPFYYGYGIRFTPNGILYNIQGLSVVKLSYITKDQKQKVVFIGTANAIELAEAIQKRYN